jgi:GT2 family glycosyltransferase
MNGTGSETLTAVEPAAEPAAVPAAEARRDKATHPRIAVIVLCYNEKDWLERCLSSVSATDYDNFRIVFVDNASADGSVELVRERFPHVEIVANRANLGYAGGNNSGIEYALQDRETDYVLLLNPDTWVEPEWLTELVRVFEADRDIGVVTAMIKNYDDERLDHNCMQIFRSIPDCVQDLWDGRLQPWYYTESGSGAACMLSRKYLEQVGIIDPVFFIYFEEIDLLRRGRYHGYKLAISTRGVVHHFNRLEDPTQKRPTKIRFERGHMIFTLKNQFEPYPKSLVKFLMEGPSRICGALLNKQWDRAWKLTKVNAELLCRIPEISLRRYREKYACRKLPEMKWLHGKG